MKKASIGKNILRLRKAKGITQEQLANIVGVSAGAVSKWENDNSTPDISLLAPLARALNTSLDELLSFQQELTTEEIHKIKQELMNLFMTEAYAMGEERCRSYIKEYSNSAQLKLTVATVIQMYGVLDNPSADIIKTRMGYALTLLEEVVQSKNSQYSSSALFAMASLHLMLENYEDCEKALKEISNAFIDPTILYASLYEREGRKPEAEKFCKSMLLQYLSQTTAILSILSRLSKEEKNYEEAALYLDGVISIENKFSIGLGSGSYNFSRLYMEMGEKEKAASYFNKYVDILVSTPYEHSHNPYFNGLQLQVNKEGQLLMRKAMVKEILKEEYFNELKDNEAYKNALTKLTTFIGE